MNELIRKSENLYTTHDGDIRIHIRRHTSGANLHIEDLDGNVRGRVDVDLPEPDSPMDFERDKIPGVNWSAMGTQPVDQTRLYAALLNLAADIAESNA